MGEPVSIQLKDLSSKIVNGFLEFNNVIFLLFARREEEGFKMIVKLLRFLLSTPARFTSYIIGIVFGFVYDEIENNRISFKDVSKSTRNFFELLMILSILSASVNWMMLISDHMAFAFYVFWQIFTVLSWSLSTGWIIISCHFGSYASLNKFLSCYIFKVVSQLTYGIYLIHHPVFLFIVLRKNRYVTAGDLVRMF